ncbi:MAG: nucleotidyltransferase family protein [Acidobacteriales bacterium]|nr:nucleotidyltransferase family protein [Terriglobales bacterium]
MSLLDEFRRITAAFNRSGIDYALCGGWAVNIYGYARNTEDIDLLILTGDLEAAKEVLRSNGFDIEGLPLSFDEGKTQIRRISKIDRETKTLFTVDLILVSEIYQRVWDGRLVVNWQDGEYRLVSKDGLLEMKRIADREKDRLDIKHLTS